MSYEETRPPTSSERETIYHSFYEIVKRCYPSCRYIDESCDDNIYIKFFSEVEIVEEDGQEKDRVGSIAGGWGSEIDNLYLLIDVKKWRAQPSEWKLVLLIHEATHVEYAEHGDGFWESFVENIWTVIREGPSPEFPDYTERYFWISVIHHPSEHSCDGDWTRYERQKWLVDALPYPQEEFEAFEKLTHPKTNNSEIGDARKAYNKLISPDTEEFPLISFFPIHDGKVTNMSVSPEYIEPPKIPEVELRGYLDDLRKDGYPPIPAPVVELKPSGGYRIVEGELSVAVAQRIGYPMIRVVNTDQKYETTEEYESELPSVNHEDM
jgi:hypothetical protein